MAVATNTVDGGLVFRLAFDLRFILDGTIDHSNSAVAYANAMAVAPSRSRSSS